MPFFDFIELPFCKVVRIEPWNASPHRYFVAYERRSDFNHVLGLPVVEEFATFSSPIFFAPIPILGKIYNAGITLAHRRDPEMNIDTGWPPLCIGIDESSTEMQVDWENQLLLAIQSSTQSFPDTKKAGDYLIAHLVIDECTLIATDAPLLPRQLRRLCRRAETAIAVAFSTGNRITRQKDGNPGEFRAVSENVLATIKHALF